jgi:prepilin-type N-terminal cleavage/methylation domain-containing protein/prepilin-type processing-associated H-X9-DG protein
MKGFPMKNRNNAFTLIELLVVIAIISLLVSVLLPSLQRAKALARATVDLSNLRSLVMAGHYYTGENGGQWSHSEYEIPSHYYTPTRFGTLGDILGFNKVILREPTVITSTRAVQKYPTNFIWWRTYGINVNCTFDKWDMHAGTGLMTRTANTIDQVRQPSEMMYFMDSVPSIYQGMFEWYYRREMMHYVGMEGQNELGDWFYIDGTFNVGFVDGHVGKADENLGDAIQEDSRHTFWSGS